MFEHVYLNIRPRADSDWKQSKPRADPDRTQKRTPRANPNFRSGPVKKTRGLLYVTGLSIRITDKLPWPIGALTNQMPDRVDQSARQRIIQCKSVLFFSSTFGLNLCILLEKNNIHQHPPQMDQHPDIHPKSHHVNLLPLLWTFHLHPPLLTHNLPSAHLSGDVHLVCSDGQIRSPPLVARRVMKPFNFKC